ncbi:hypothetical protein HDV00_010046 [Rhizophlyctis rosea]|nr:hypothetical protein HDV00_010046 [Rhizophlyctis rosea]
MTTSLAPYTSPFAWEDGLGHSDASHLHDEHKYLTIHDGIPHLSHSVSDEDDGGETESEGGVVGGIAGGMNSGVGMGAGVGGGYGQDVKFGHHGGRYEYQAYPALATFPPMMGYGHMQGGHGHYVVDHSYEAYHGSRGPLVQKHMYAPTYTPYPTPPRTSEPTQSPYTCTYPSCTRPFATLAALKSHLRSHASQSARNSPYSDASSTTSSPPPPQAEPHKVHACPSCPATFRRTHDLKRHFRSIHTGEKPFVCGVCRSGFARRDALKRHVGRVGSMCFGAGGGGDGFGV